ncbi:MAG: hypothetical protein QW046_04740 [Candidatus Micrarchaeaceae archaeon]|uniref:hypothetical protein n=1 Tax=Metallosphaera sp. TaxID=2020860 RepID=UPI00316E668F
MSPEKYEFAINLKVKEIYGLIEEDDRESELIKSAITRLITRIRDDFSFYKNVKILLSMNSSDIVKILFHHGDSISKAPRILAHWRTSCLWNYENRVKLVKDRTFCIIISADDIRSIIIIYDDMELN